MTRLRPMEDEEYGPYLQVLRDAYIRDLVESGLMDRADAATKVDADIEAQLSEGPKTPDAYLYVIEDDAGSAVGYVWMARQPDQVGKPTAFVYDIWIHEGSRGRGLGRSAMVALEEEVRSLGLDRIHLNVFGSNTPAAGSTSRSATPNTPSSWGRPCPTDRLDAVRAPGYRDRTHVRGRRPDGDRTAARDPRVPARVRRRARLPANGS